MELNQSLGFAVNHVGRLLGAALAERLAPLGLTPAQWLVLEYVNQQPATHQELIARDLGSDAATLAGVLARLEAQGFVERTEDPHDRRRKLVRPGPRPTPRTASSDARDVNDQALRGFTSSEQVQLFAFLERLRANLTRPTGSPC